MRRVAPQLLSTDLPSLAGAAWRWWLGELRALMPARLLASRHGTLVIDLLDGEVAMFYRGEDRRFESSRISADQLKAALPPTALAEQLRRLAASPYDVLVRLPPEKLLRKVVRLPLAAGRRLRAILAHEIDRQTPLDSSQVYFDYRILARDKAAGTVEVELAIIKHETALRADKLLRWLGIEAAAIGLADDRALTQRYDLLPGKSAAARQQSRRLLNAALAAVAGLLALAMLGAFLWQEENLASAVAAQLGQFKGSVQAVAQLRKDIDQATKQAGFLAQQKQQPLLVKILDETTQLLPDGSWLFGFEVNGSEVRLHGYSPMASKLIAAFDGSPLFTNARFRAPLTQGPGSGLERFDLSFDLR